MTTETETETRVRIGRLRQPRIEAIKARLRALASGADEATKLLVELEDLYGEQETAAVEGLFREVGEFIVHYDPAYADLWQVMYIKLTGATDAASAGTGLNAESHVRGDEWRYLFGDDWRSEAERLGVPVKPVAGGDDGD